MWNGCIPNVRRFKLISEWYWKRIRKKMGLPTLNVCPLKLSSYNCPLLVVNWGAWALKPGGRDLELVLSSMESPPLAIEVLKCALQADKTIGCTYFYCNRSIFFDNSARVLLWQKKKMHNFEEGMAYFCKGLWRMGPPSVVTHILMSALFKGTRQRPPGL